MDKDYYKILQVDSAAEPEVVQAAYRKLAQKYHPDTNRTADAKYRMQEVNEAYEVLCDPDRRAGYDLQYKAYDRRERQPADDQRRAEYEQQQKTQVAEQKKKQTWLLPTLMLGTVVIIALIVMRAFASEQPKLTDATQSPGTPALITPESASKVTATSVPTATPLPASSSACLVGTWELSDMSQYMQSVIAQSGGAVEFVGQTGRITYVFGADGSAQVDAQDFTMRMSMAVEKLTFELNVTISGGATSTFTATDDTVTFSDGELRGLKFSATMNGTELFNSTPAELAAMFGVSPDPKYNTFGYQCDATTLTYTPPVENAQPVVMKRVP